MRKIIVVGVIMVLLAPLAQAEGIYIHLLSPRVASTTADPTPVPVPTTGRVQVIRGNANILPANNANQLATGHILIEERAVGEIGRGPGEFEVQYGTEPANSPVFIRVWPSGVARGNYYGTSTQGYASASGAFPADWSPARFNCIYIADVPAAPTIDSVNLVYVEKTGALVGKATVNLSPDPEHEVSQYEIDIRLRGAGSALFTKLGSSPIATDPDAVIQQLALSTDYEVWARAGNNYGWGPWTTTPTYFRTASGGGAGGPVTINCNFKKDSGGLGVNQFMVPGNTPISFNGTTPVTTIQELINAIKALGVTVNTFGWWDETASPQLARGWTDASGSSPVAVNAPGNLTDPLVKDRVYQVSVDGNVTFTLSGTR